MKIKQDKYDKTFSKLIKLRDVCCQKCGRVDAKLECSHIFSRRHAGTRHDPANAKLLCFACHRWWHENPIEAVEWLRGVIGADKYDRLRLKAHKITKLSKFDKDQIRKEHTAEIKKMEAGTSAMQSFNPEFRAIVARLGQLLGD